MNGNESLIWALKLEQSIKDRSGIYGYTQRAMAYNSNRIEGSTLTEKQTAYLFEEGYLPASDDAYKSRDIEEMNGHFLMFNRMLSCVGMELSEEMIKSFHYELKAGVFEDRANGYAVGEYKERANMVGGTLTTMPQDVAGEVGKLLSWYRALPAVTLGELAAFHIRYEAIHPFQDGNGRTGRMILFRECLEHEIPPFIIHDRNRARYFSAFGMGEGDGAAALAELFRQEQGSYAATCELFDVSGRYARRMEQGGSDD